MTAIRENGLPLLIGISTRALFDLEEEHQVFEAKGLEAYSALQRERENVPLKPGAAFEVVSRLLSLNTDQERVVDVVFLSRNSPDLSLRAFNSAKHHGLPIQRGSFTSGRSVAPFVEAWGIDLFLSNEQTDVTAAAGAGTAAARLSPPPPLSVNDVQDEVRIALDGDAVVFGDEGDRIYKEQGLQAFLLHEQRNAQVPMARGTIRLPARDTSPFNPVHGPSSCATSRALSCLRWSRFGRSSWWPEIAETDSS